MGSLVSSLNSPLGTTTRPVLSSLNGERVQVPCVCDTTRSLPYAITGRVSNKRIRWRFGLRLVPDHDVGSPLSFQTLSTSTIPSMIALGLLYLAAGTLYNRYVLQLRGVDQVPQFSLESMKYHASEAIELLKDLAERMRSGGAYNRTSSGSYHSGPPSHRTPRPGPTEINPVSHQTQVPSATTESGGSGFVRPQPRGLSTAGKINPISHQAQNTTTSSAPPLPPTVNRTGPPPPPPKKDKPRPRPMNLESTAEEREFMLGDDEDEGDYLSGPILQSAAPLQATNVAPLVEAAAGSTQAAGAAVERERDIGSDGIIRL